MVYNFVYAIGSSFNDIGKKRFFMMKLENKIYDITRKKGAVKKLN